MRRCLALTITLLTVFLVTNLAVGDDALPSWNEGDAKKAIVDFVQRVTAAGGADFMPVARRIAVFDNDGNLWSEKPMDEAQAKEWLVVDMKKDWKAVTLFKSNKSRNC